MADVKYDGLQPLLTSPRFSSKEGELIVKLPNEAKGGKESAK